MKSRYPTRQLFPAPSTPLESKQGHLEGTAPEPDSPLLFSFVMGLDEKPRPMSREEIEELGDVFSQEHLLPGSPPITLRAVVEAIAGTNFEAPEVFLVAEGGQFALEHPDFELNARFAIAWRRSPGADPDLLVSTVDQMDDPEALLQLIAWSEATGSYHYFERRRGFWGWAGHSPHSLSAPTRGLGPFDSHVNGALVMKELKAPWGHWHSQRASIPREAFPPESEFSTEPLFARVDDAEELEKIVRRGIRRWMKSRLKGDRTDGGLTNADQYFRQIIASTTVNLISSGTRAELLETDSVSFPMSFLLDVEGFQTALGLTQRVVPSTNLEIDGPRYLAASKSLGMTVPDTDGVGDLPGDTHLVFMVPERAAEDQEAARRLVRAGILDGNLFACLLMVDFHQPIWSPRRVALLRHVPQHLKPGEDFNALFIEALRLVAQSPSGEGSPEADLLSYYDQDPALRFQRMKTELKKFTEGLADQLATEAGLDLFLQLAETRKNMFREQKLHEFPSTTSSLDPLRFQPVVIDALGQLSRSPNQEAQENPS